MINLDKIYQVNLPNTITDLVKFDFTASIDEGGFHFYFWWFNNRWNCWVILPSGEIRNVGIFSNCMSWQCYTDYSILVYFSNDTILFSDISKIGVYIFKWQ